MVLEQLYQVDYGALNVPNILDRLRVTIYQFDRWPMKELSPWIRILKKE